MYHKEYQNVTINRYKVHINMEMTHCPLFFCRLAAWKLKIMNRILREYVYEIVDVTVCRPRSPDIATHFI
jgi:hypothetical protein